MEAKFEFDFFMLCLDVSNYYPDYDAAFFLEKFKNYKEGKVYVLSFRSLKNNLKIKYSTDQYKWVDRKQLSFSSIKETIEKLEKTDILIIIGGERLTRFLPNSSIASLEVGKKQSNLHLQSDEDWETFAHEIDEIYYLAGKLINGLIFICNVNEKIVEKINISLKDSNNMSIMSTQKMEDYGESLSNIDDILGQMKDQSLKTCLKIIDNNRERLSNEQIQMCKAVAHFENGNITKAISILNDEYVYLSDEQKAFLAELYILKDDKTSAQNIFEELYSTDCQQRGIYELGLRSYPENSERYKKILMEAVKYQSENGEIIERYANWLSSNEQFEEAAQWFRKIGQPYYELVAKVNDLLAQDQTDLKIVQAYIFDIVEQYPELKDEAILRVGLYALKKGHIFSAYNIFQEADTTIKSDTIKKIIYEKIKILIDTSKASKALRKLKPYSRQGDMELLIAERCKVLYETVKNFALESEGFYVWREMLECQQASTWVQGIKKYVIGVMRKISKIDIEEMLRKSYIHNLHANNEKLDCQTAIRFLRKNNSGEILEYENEISRDEIIKGSYIVGEKFGTIIEKAWISYYCSLGASIFNENPQDANGFSLRIIELSDSYNESKELPAALFLLSWGNAQFGLGNSIEGIVCVNIAIEKFLSVDEIIPVIEEGGNILAKFLIMYEKLFTVDEKKEISEYMNKLQKYNDTFVPAYNKFMGSTFDLVSLYQEKLENKSEKNVEWLIDLGNLIQILFHNKKGKEAVEYIKDNYQYAKKIFDQRKDIAAQMLHTWGKIIFAEAEGADFFALELLDEAINQIKIRRKVHHQEERAALAEEYDTILRDYLCFAGILYNLKTLNKEEKEHLKTNILEKMAICLPLSIIEQKYYYKTKFISAEMEIRHKDLKSLKREYGIMIQNGNNNSEEFRQISNRIDQLTKELVENHPYYKALVQYAGTDWKKVQNSLGENEVVYQYVLTDLSVISVLVTKDWIDIHTKLVDLSYDSPKAAMKKYGIIVDNSDIKGKEVDKLSVIISELVAEHLCEYVYNYDVKSVYIIPDVSTSYFPMAAIKYKREYIIDKVKEIINFIDYKQLLDYIKTPKHISKIVNRLYGKSSDQSINKIKKWLLSRENEDFINIIDENDDIDNLKTTISQSNIDTIAIYGHGVRNPDSNLIEGAQSIEGNNSMIQMRSILNDIIADNLILISCVGGTPNNINPEVSSGTWSNIFERFSGVVISCKWSVPTEDTIELIDQLYNYSVIEKMNIGESLIKAQQYMKNNGKGELSWAGIECWVN